MSASPSAERGSAIHRHRCLRCDEEFDCRTPDICVARHDVLPRIVELKDGEVVISDHCPPTPTWDWIRARLARERIAYLGVMTMQPYKGFTARLTPIENSNRTHGDVEGTGKDVVTFEGGSAEELECAFREAVDDYLAWTGGPDHV